MTSEETGPAGGTAPEPRAGRMVASAQRSDIQGMRAVAVLLVLFFHMGISRFAGGFVGVDVFFVISGFLITGLLIREAERTGGINFAQFYARRLKRLAPTYLAVLAVTTAVIWWFLSPLQVVQYLPQVLAALGYAANIYFGQQLGGYFAATDPSPVLHFWSLAVEEQFYLTWPLLIFLVLRLGAQRFRRRLTVAFAAIAAASLACSIVLTVPYPSTSYYLLHTRGWQLAVGALLAVAAARGFALPARARGFVVGIGLAIILASALLITTTTPFPGTAAIWPVLGSLLVLMAGLGGASRPARVLLGNRAMVLIGDLSYSLYLWHWPILMLPRLAAGHPLPSWQRLGLGALAVGVAFANFRLVEEPIRALSLKGRVGKTFVISLSLSLVLALVCAGAWRATARRLADMGGRGSEIGLAAALRGLPAGVRADYASPDLMTADGGLVVPARLTPRLQDLALDLAPVFTNGCSVPPAVGTVKECAGGDTSSSRTIVLAGDSHAGEWSPALERVASVEGYRLVTMIKNSCPSVPIPITRHPTLPGPFPCIAFQDDLQRRLVASPPDVLVIANNEDGYRVFPGMEQDYDARWDAALAGLLAKLSATTRVVYLGDNARFPDGYVNCLGKHIADPMACAARVTAAGTAFQASERAVVEAAGARFIDLRGLLCAAGVCPPVSQGRIIMRDESHVTLSFAPLLAPLIGEAIREG